MEVLSDDVWKFFLNPMKNSKESSEFNLSLSLSQWTWIVQTNKLRNMNVKSLSDNEITLRIPKRTQFFEIRIERSEGFPNVGPIVKADYEEGFDFYVWNRNMSLEDLVADYTKYCDLIDDVLFDFKEARCDGFYLESLKFEEDDNTQMVAVLQAYKYDEVLTLVIEYEDPRSFPLILRCSNSSRIEKFNCERWMSNEPIGVNLGRIYGENGDKLVGNEEKEEEGIVGRTESNDDSFMDFI